MSNSLTITGKLLIKYDTQHVNDRFKKREFVETISNLLSLNITPDTITKHLQQLNKTTYNE